MDLNSAGPPEAATLAARWLSRLEAAFAGHDVAAAVSLFGAECYWRDLVALTWNIRTSEGQSAIAAMLAHVMPHARMSNIRPAGAATEAAGLVEAWFTFETPAARGTGHLRLKGGLCFTILTAITELKGHEEKHGHGRDKGIVHGAHKDRKIWIEERRKEEHELGRVRQPYCLIVGGGQGGIALGARLRRLGVPTIIAEKHARPGDSWRKRYRSLVLHDPVWYDHLPYIPFPEHWPVFSPKDKIADWLEMYAKVMELNYWGNTECLKAKFDAAANEWSVVVRRDGEELTLRPRQLVFATGSYGPPRHVSIEGQERFTGRRYHSSEHESGAGAAGQRVVVVGGNSSAHDICMDYWEHGADVTMIQRTPTTVVRSETLMDVAFGSLYSEAAVENGMTTDKADLTFASVPFRLLPDSQRPLYDEIARRDASLLTRLNRAGFRTDFGPDGSGLLMKALRTGSGYYIDVGCSELIASGRVKVKSGVEAQRFTEDGLILSDGTALPADIVVFATGFLPMNEWVAQMISREVADRIGPNWGYGSGTRGDPGPWEGELRNMWKPLKQENLWFHGGNLHLSRFHSLHVALQIKARMEGIAGPVY